MQVHKNELQRVLGEVIKKYRKDKSISLISNEIDLSKSVWSELEKGNKDIQFSTLWRIAEALEIRPHELVKEVENHIGKDFSFLE